jgi:hypothetical protein
MPMCLMASNTGIPVACAISIPFRTTLHWDASHSESWKKLYKNTYVHDVNGRDHLIKQNNTNIIKLQAFAFIDCANDKISKMKHESQCRYTNRIIPTFPISLIRRFLAWSLRTRIPSKGLVVMFIQVESRWHLHWSAPSSILSLLRKLLRTMSASL